MPEEFVDLSHPIGCPWDKDGTCRPAMNHGTIKVSGKSAKASGSPVIQVYFIQCPSHGQGPYANWPDLAIKAWNDRVVVDTKAVVRLIEIVNVMLYDNQLAVMAGHGLHQADLMTNLVATLKSFDNLKAPASAGKASGPF